MLTGFEWLIAQKCWVDCNCFWAGAVNWVCLLLDVKSLMPWPWHVGPGALFSDWSKSTNHKAASGSSVVPAGCNYKKAPIRFIFWDFHGLDSDLLAPHMAICMLNVHMCTCTPRGTLSVSSLSWKFGNIFAWTRHNSAPCCHLMGCCGCWYPKAFYMVQGVPCRLLWSRAGSSFAGFHRSWFHWLVRMHRDEHRFLWLCIGAAVFCMGDL